VLDYVLTLTAGACKVLADVLLPESELRYAVLQDYYFWRWH
jgi:hypothetical protein